MPRQPRPERRAELEAALLQYVLEHGIGELSLRPLAAALGTSTYSLVYHFGTKENVVASALRGVNKHLLDLFATWAQSSSPGDLMRRYWEWTSSAENRPYLRTYYEIYGLSLHDPERFPGFLESDGLPSWGATVKALLVRQGDLPAKQAERLATILIATVAGLQLDLLTSDDRARTTAAMETSAAALDDLAEQIKRSASPPKADRSRVAQARRAPEPRRSG